MIILFPLLYYYDLQILRYCIAATWSPFSRAFPHHREVFLIIIYKTTEPQRGRRHGWQMIVLTMQVSSLRAVFGGLKMDVRKSDKRFC